MARTEYRIFDADVHHQFPSNAVVDKYLREQMAAPYYGGGGAVQNVNGSFRLDAIPPDGSMPGSDPGFVAADHLDRHGIEYVVLSCGSFLHLSSMHDLDRAGELQRAVNDWTVAEWFPADERYLGSITVTTSDPSAAAEEVRRVGTHPRMVQVCATGLPCPMGNPFLHPIYEACNEVGLPFTLHQGGPPPGIGLAPTSFVELHIDMCLPALQHLISLVTEGVFEKYPRLTVVFNEFGVAWLPFIMWRLDMEYRAGREELPWLTKLPSEYIAERVRFTTQPLEEPKDPRDLAKMLALFPAERMLMFSSDYPHWDADDPTYALRHVPEEWHQRIFFDNAYETFQIGERLAASAAVAGAV
jgi:predicted TIM-barrel fold metal-dependent hydrolase